jgi:hypothetical protein
MDVCEIRVVTTSEAACRPQAALDGNVIFMCD